MKTRARRLLALAGAGIAAFVAVLSLILFRREPRAPDLSPGDSDRRCSAANRPSVAVTTAARRPTAQMPRSADSTTLAPPSQASVSSLPADPNVLREMARGSIVAAQVNVAEIDFRIAMLEAGGHAQEAAALKKERQRLIDQIAAMRQEAGVPAEQPDDPDAPLG
jgi:hypothetical protein